MLDIREIEKEIAVIELAKDHSHGDCLYLAALYSIRDHQKGDTHYHEPSAFSQMPVAYSQAEYKAENTPAISAKVEISGNSEFLRSISGKNTNDILRVIDELMDSLKLGNLRVYQNVMDKVQAL